MQGETLTDPSPVMAFCEVSINPIYNVQASIGTAKNKLIKSVGCCDGA
jgi:hypothetical protein